MKRLLTFTLIIFLLLAHRASTQETTSGIRVDLTTVTIRAHPAIDWAQILGQVVNETENVLGQVTVNVTIKGADGSILDAAQSPYWARRLT